MKFFRNLPIRRKLMVITMLVSGSALLVACGAFMAFEQAAARKQMAQALNITAAMTAANSTAGLSFNEADSVEQALKSLGAQPDIRQACVYDKDGRPFARYLRDPAATNSPPPVQTAGGHFTRQRLELFQAINLAGESIGTIYLEQDLSQLTARRARYFQIGVLVLLVSAGVAFFLSAWLQQAISKPISDLAKTVAAVRTEKNYSVRAARLGHDELGSLIDGFNEMLAQIQARDAHLERRVAERTRDLAESLSVLDATLGSTADGIVVVNAQGKVLFQNRRSVEMWKMPPAIAENDHDDEKVRHVMNATTDPAKFAERVAHYYAHPEATGQDEIRLKDGTIMDRITAPVLDREGRNYGRIWTFRDVTQRKLAEAELAYERDLLRTLLDNSTDHIYFKDAHSRFIKCSTSMAVRLGVASADELVGKSDFDFFAEEHARLAFADEQAIIRTGQPIIGKIERESWKDGRKESWVLTAKMPFRNHAGEIIGTVGISKDFTIIKHTEMALAYERDLLKALLDQSPDSIFFKDRQSRYVRVSQSEVKSLFQIALLRQAALPPAPGAAHLPAHLASLERFQEYLIGKSDADIFGPERAAEFVRDEQEIMRTGKSLSGKIEKTICANGQPVWFLINRTPWYNQAGKIVGTFGSSQNITDLKLAEARIEQTHRQLLETSRLAGMAEVATTVLHNVGNVLNSVNVSTTLVLDLVKKSRLGNLARLAALIHDQQANLAAFLLTDPRGKLLPGYLTQLAEHLAAEQAQLVAETELTRKNIEHIKDIVTMQQNYAKVSGVVEKVKVTDLVEDALRMNAGALTRHAVQVVRDYPAAAVECNVERQKVLQILVNLIRNAKYACDESGRPDKRLTLQVRFAGRRAQITVQDNGVGIPAENLTRIFNHGFTTRATGHGFGLHSGALAAKELGGSLTACSAGPGAGATFVLDLPLQPPQQS
jgi:PAS domain S-box-containing protein